MLRCGREALSNQFLFVVSAKRLQQQGQVAGSEVLVDVRNLALQIRLVALAEAARDKDLVEQPGLFGLYGLEDGVDRLLLGVFNESACIDDDNSALLFVHDIFAGGLELAHENFAVVYVFGTAKRNDINAVFGRRLRAHILKLKLEVMN